MGVRLSIRWTGLKGSHSQSEAKSGEGSHRIPKWCQKLLDGLGDARPQPMCIRRVRGLRRALWFVFVQVGSVKV